MRIKLTTIVAALVLLAGWLLLLFSLRDTSDRGRSLSATEQSDADPETGELLVSPLGNVTAWDEPGERSAAIPAGRAAAPEDPGAPARHGRVVDRFQLPLPGASVVLDFGRGDLRCLRALTDAAGRFVLPGEAFRSDQVRLQVTHDGHAPALFERLLDARELDLGDLILEDGGEVIGRVLDLAAHPLPGASVRLQASEENRLRRTPDPGELLRTALVESDGTFRLRHVAAGGWRIVATASEHQERTSAKFMVENGQRTKVEDLELGPGFAIAGLVLDASSEPVRKAGVTVQPPRGVCFRTETDAEGGFRLDHLPGVPSRLAVLADGYLRFEQPDFDPRSAPRSITVTLQDGLTITGVVTDAARNAPVTRFAAFATRIRDLPRGAGLHGGRAARPAAAKADGRLFGDDLGEPADHPDGRFSLTGLQEGVYWVAVQSPDHTRWRSGEIELRAGTVPSVTAALERGHALAGLVRDVHGSAVHDARVELRRAERDPSGQANRGGGTAARPPVWSSFPALETRSDRSGRFVLAHVPEGSYGIVASARGHASARSEVIELVLDVGGIPLTLPALGTITGVVGGSPSSCSAEAMRSAIVVALPVALAVSQREMEQARALALLQEDGSYRIENVPPGDYAVRASLGGVADLWQRFCSQLLAGELAADVTVRGGDVVRFDVQLEAPDAGSVAGTVTNNARPGQGLELTLERLADDGELAGASGRGAARARVTVGPSGTFTLAGVRAGQYELTVHRNGGGGTALARESLTVLAQEATEIHLAVSTGSLRGTLTTDDDSDPQSLSGVVTALPGSAELPPASVLARRDPMRVVVPLENGAFRLDAIAPGQYLMLVCADGRKRVTVPVTVRADDTQELQVLAGGIDSDAPAR